MGCGVIVGFRVMSVCLGVGLGLRALVCYVLVVLIVHCGVCFVSYFIVASLTLGAC